MELEVERSGGITGRTVRWSLDLETLAPEQRAEVQALLTQADGWAAGGAGADRFSYRLLTRPGGDPASPQHQPLQPALDVRVAEPLPDAARRLLEVVRAAAR